MSELEFSQKYNQQHAEYYFHKHDTGFWRQLSTWRDRQIARKALKLAGNPQTVLDLPCGTGRFWGVLAEQADRTIHVCDNSQDMIDAGLKFRPADIVKRISSSFQGSAFNLPVDDNFVENVFCARLIHHMGEEKDRLALLKELRRVTSSTVIISLWVDGNLQAWKRKRKEAKKYTGRFQNRFLISAETIESEFAKSGFKVEHKLDFTKFHSMWSTYILRKV